MEEKIISFVQGKVYCQAMRFSYFKLGIYLEL